MGAWQLNAQATHGFDSQQGRNERRSADAYRPLAQSIQPRLPAAFDKLEQVIEALSLLGCHAVHQ